MQTSALLRLSTLAMPDFDRADFENARRTIEGLEQFIDYDDWLDFAQGMYVGRGMAGIELTLVPVTSRSFGEWCRKRSVRPSLCVLDDFVALELEGLTGPNLEERTGQTGSVALHTWSRK